MLAEIRKTVLLCLLLALSAFPVTACRCNVTRGAGASAGPFSPMAKSGPETWNISGTEYRIASTYYLALPDGVQFTIDYEAPPGSDFEGMTDARAFEIVKPLMRHVIATDRHKREVIRDGSGAPVEVKKIGVSLFSQSGIRTHGYRVARTIEELKNPRPAAPGADAPPN